MSRHSDLSRVPHTPHLRVGSWFFFSPLPLRSPRLCVNLFS
jgi:hypothetical protein